MRGRDDAGETRALAMLGPGDYFGEIALVTGAERTADVVAMTAMALLQLRKDDYTRYLAHMAEVDQQLTRTAALRAGERLRHERRSSTS